MFVRFRRLGFTCLVTALAAMFPLAAFAQQSSSIEVMIDSPVGNTTVQNGQQIDVGGWAVDSTMTSGTGIDQVVLSIDGPITSSSMQIPMTLGISRPDVANAFSRSDWATAGYNLNWNVQGLSDGQHTIYVNAHSTRGTWSSGNVTIAAVAAPPVAVAPPMPMAPPLPLMSSPPPPLPAQALLPPMLPPSVPVGSIESPPSLGSPPTIAANCLVANYSLPGPNGPVSVNGAMLCP